MLEKFCGRRLLTFARNDKYKDMKVHYDKDEDILMIQLSDKKIDDTLETENSLISVSKDGEPVMLEMFHASKFFAAY